jgi:hypothetical protein
MPALQPAPIEGSDNGPKNIEQNCLPRKYNPAEFDKVSAERDTHRNAYEHVLWAYAEGICSTSPERLEYLMTVELPFHLKTDVFVDLELFVNAILTERSQDYPQKVAA